MPIEIANDDDRDALVIPFPEREAPPEPDGFDCIRPNARVYVLPVEPS